MGVDGFHKQSMARRDGTNFFHNTDITTLQSTIPKWWCLPRKEQKFRTFDSQKQRRSQADSRPTSTGQKGTFPLVPPRLSRTRRLSPLTSTLTRPGVGWPQNHDTTATAGMCATESRPPASAVYPNPLYFGVMSVARQLPARAGTFCNGGIRPLFHDGVPRRASTVPSHGGGSHPTSLSRAHPKTRSFSRPRNPSHPPYRNKTNPLPSRHISHPTCKAHGNLRPLPQPFPSQGAIVPSSHHPQHHHPRRIRIAASPGSHQEKNRPYA